MTSTESAFGDMGVHFHFHFQKKEAPVTLTKDQLQRIFMQCDTNQDKVLSRDEIKKAFRQLGALFPGFRADRGLSRADANGDGNIDFQELNDLVNYAYKLGYCVK